MAPTYKYTSQVSRGFMVSVCAHANVCVHMRTCSHVCLHVCTKHFRYLGGTSGRQIWHHCFVVGHWEDGETAGVSESDSKQFILLHLNCHLMRLQSGALSKKQLISHSSVQGRGAESWGRWKSKVLLGLTIKSNQKNATFHLKHSVSLVYYSKWFCREKKKVVVLF